MPLKVSIVCLRLTLLRLPPRRIFGPLLAAALLCAFAGPFRARAQDAFTPLRERVLAKDADGALALIAKLPAELAGSPEIQYLKARLYEQQDKYREALASLPRTQDGLPARLARDISERRALWLARSGRCAEARWMLSALSERDGPDAELTLRAADCALNQGDAATAFALLRGIRGSAARRFAVRFTLAKLLSLTGDRDGAVRDLRALYVDSPEHPRNGEVEALLLSIRPTWQLTDEDRLERAEQWLAAQQHDLALAEIATLKPAKDQKALRARVAHVRGLILFRTRTNYDEAGKLLSQAAELGGPAHADDAFMAAQALARADKDPQAVRAYRAFAKEHPRHRLAQEAMHDAAWLELRHDLRGGEANMKKFMKDAERRGERGLATSALWELAFQAFTHKHYDKALPLFERYAKTGDGAMVKARGLYWAGRCALQTKKRALGIEYLRGALAVEPLHFYSLLARTRLVSIGVDPGPPFGIAKGAITSASDSARTIEPLSLPADVALYVRLGLIPDALAALQAQETSVREGMAGDSLVALAHAYQGFGEYSRPYHLAERERDDVVRDPPVGPARAVWDTLFPRPWPDAVRYASQDAEVPEDLVYAIMRKESAYNPSVVSGADAVGLVQLLERTARDLAGTLQWKEFDRGLLYEPSVNLLLGAHLLSTLLERYRGQAVPAIAAYNAGEHRVDPWLKRAPRSAGSIELDRFVEDIPIDQTRNYVRRVISNWARYRYLEHPVGWPMDLPLTLTVRGPARSSG